MRFAYKKILQTHSSEKWWNKFYFMSLQSSLHCDRSYFKSYIHPIHFFLSLAWWCSQPLKLHFRTQPNTLSPSAKRGEKGKESGGNQFLSFRPFIRLTPVSHANVRQTLRHSRSILSYDSSKGLASNTFCLAEKKILLQPPDVEGSQKGILRIWIVSLPFIEHRLQIFCSLLIQSRYFVWAPSIEPKQVTRSYFLVTFRNLAWVGKELFPFFSLSAFLERFRVREPPP